MVELGDGEDRLAGHHILALTRVALDHDAADRAVDRHLARRFVGGRDLVDLFVGQAPQAQLLARGVEGRLVDHGERRTGRSLRSGRGRRLAQLRLGGEQLRTEDLGEVVVLGDADTGVVDVETLDPAGEVGGDGREARLVVFESADQADLTRRKAPLDDGGRDRPDRERRRLISLIGATFDGGDQVHLTDRAEPRPVAADLRVHRAGVLDRCGFGRRSRPGASSADPQAEEKECRHRGEDDERDQALLHDGSFGSWRPTSASSSAIVIARSASARCSAS